jgi:hypothetical protein
MTDPSIDPDTLLADPSRLAAALSTLLLQTAALILPIADRTGDPVWRTVVVELDLIVSRLREIAEAPGGAPLSERAATRRPQA